MRLALPRPDRTLLWCIALVLLAHAWLLYHLPETIRIGPASAADAPASRMQPVLSLRRIEAAPSSAAPSLPAAAPAPRPGARVVRPDTAAASAASTTRDAALAAAKTAAVNEGAEPSAAAQTEAGPLAMGSAPAAPATTTATTTPTSTPTPTPTSLPTITPAAPPAVTPTEATTPAVPSSASAASAAPAAPVPATPAPAASRAAGSAIGPLAIAGSTRLRYLIHGESRGQPYQVNASLLWQHDGQQYEARLEISAWPLGTRTQTSRGRITSEGLAPQRFGDRFRGERAAHFQRDKGVISFSSNAPDAPLQPGAQDRLSVLLQLGAMLGGDAQRYPAQSVIQIQTAGIRDAEAWSFRVIGADALQLPGGTMQAIKLERLPRREYDQHIEVWLAPALEYLPVRVRITQGNGDVIDQQWLARDSL